jgi:hypothetical protein
MHVLPARLLPEHPPSGGAHAQLTAWRSEQGTTEHGPVPVSGTAPTAPLPGASSPLRSKCTAAESGHGRTVAIAENEQLQHHLRRQMATPSGRAKLRKRSRIEHRLAHIARRQRHRALAREPTGRAD